MRANPIPHYFNIFPTGNIPVPVCIGDLPLSHYVVSYKTSVEQVANHLQANPLVPGVIVIQGERLLGVVSRHKMFERLGRRYGVELFLGKPVSDLLLELRTDILSLKPQIHISAAAKLALSRSQDGTYDPIVVEFEDGRFALLDMYVLLLSQSQLLNNLNGVVGTLNEIEIALSSDSTSRNVLELILESLRLVVPYHNAEVLLQSHSVYDHLKPEKHVTILDDLWRSNDIYRAVFTMNQPVNIEDVHMAPAWRGVHAALSTRAWMGLPLSDQNGIAGLLSLSRFSVSPFNNNEKELAQVFARHIKTFLVNQSRQMERAFSYSRLF